MSTVISQSTHAVGHVSHRGDHTDRARERQLTVGDRDSVLQTFSTVVRALLASFQVALEPACTSASVQAIIMYFAGVCVF